MPNTYQSVRKSGILMQSGINRSTKPNDWMNPQGLMMRGVVIATYVIDDENHPQNKENRTPKAVYCDVLCYAGISGQRFQFIPHALVSQVGNGIHDGKVWKPKATTVDLITGNALDPNKATNPASMDGDHVLVSFLDNSLNQPIILGCIPHPNVDKGNEDKEVGHRLNLKVADGDPDFWKHHGSFYGLDDNGNFIVDLTEAHNGQLLTGGKEPDPVEDGSVGNFTVKLPKSSKLTLEIDGGDNIELELKDGNAKLKLGDGAKSAVIAETLQTWWDSTVKPHLDKLYSGMSGWAPAAGDGGLALKTALQTPPNDYLTSAHPTFDANAISTKLTFPDG